VPLNRLVGPADKCEPA